MEYKVLWSRWFFPHNFLVTDKYHHFSACCSREVQINFYIYFLGSFGPYFHPYSNAYSFLFSVLGIQNFHEICLKIFLFFNFYFYNTRRSNSVYRVDIFNSGNFTSVIFLNFFSYYLVSHSFCILWESLCQFLRSLLCAFFFVQYVYFFILFPWN